MNWDHIRHQIPDNLSTFSAARKCLRESENLEIAWTLQLGEVLLHQKKLSTRLLSKYVYSNEHKTDVAWL